MELASKPCVGGNLRMPFNSHKELMTMHGNWWFIGVGNTQKGVPWIHLNPMRPSED